MRKIEGTQRATSYIRHVILGVIELCGKVIIIYLVYILHWMTTSILDKVKISRRVANRLVHDFSVTVLPIFRLVFQIEIVFMKTITE